MTRRPNILMIVTDEERAVLPRAQGYELPARERIAALGTTCSPRSHRQPYGYSMAAADPTIGGPRQHVPSDPAITPPSR